MASVVTTRRQLAPTVGPAVALVGVHIRTGSDIRASGERIVSGLVQRWGSLEFVSDNAGCFGNAPPPRDGIFLNLGSHRIYIAKTVPCRYPAQVCTAADPPLSGASGGRHRDSSVTYAEVLMTAPAANAGKGPATATEDSTSKRQRWAPKEKQLAGTSQMPAKANQIHRTIEKLATPVTAGADPALTAAQLEEQRIALLKEAEALAETRREIDLEQREYYKAHGYDLDQFPRLGRAEELRLRGRNLGVDMDDVGDAPSALGNSCMSAPRPVYSTPEKNMRAAQQAARDMDGLTGEALRKQQLRVQELLEAANKLNAAYKKQNPGAASAIAGSEVRAGNKSLNQASSPNVGPRREYTADNGKQKQLQTYDSGFAGKRMAAQGDAGPNNNGRNGGKGPERSSNSGGGVK